jgi:hypothetical protein
MVRLFKNLLPQALQRQVNSFQTKEEFLAVRDG